MVMLPEITMKKEHTLNGDFCGIPDFQMQPGNGNFSRRSDIHKIIPE
jgi:hypothetical protein